MCHMSHVICFPFPFFHKVVKLVGGGSVINRATPFSFHYNDKFKKKYIFKKFLESTKKKIVKLIIIIVFRDNRFCNLRYSGPKNILFFV